MDKLLKIFKSRFYQQSIISIALVIVFSFIAFKSIEKRTRVELNDSLYEILNSSSASIEEWRKNRVQKIILISTNKEVVDNVKALLKVNPQKETLKNLKSQKELRKILKPVIKDEDDLGFFVINPDFINIGSMRDVNLGDFNLLKDDKEYLKRMLKGEALITLPMKSDVPLPDKMKHLSLNVPTMFVGAPVKDEKNKIIAVLLFRMNPSVDFTRIAKIGYFGDSGETYFFNEEGLILSESRFEDGLKSIGLINEGETSILKVSLRNPERKLNKKDKELNKLLEMDFTKSVQEAIETKKAGVNIEGYHDYRGVKVVGAWGWNDVMGFGIASEVDYNEAYRLNNNIKKVIFILVSIIIVIFIVSGRRLNNLFIVSEKLREDVSATLDKQEVLNEILRISIDEMIFDEKLEAIMELLQTYKKLSLSEKGLVYVKNKESNLFNLKAYNRLVLDGSCTSISLDLSDYHCTVKDCSSKGLVHKCFMNESNAYFVPIKVKGEVLALMILYLESENVISEENLDFFNVVSKTMAALVELHNFQDEITKLSYVVEQNPASIFIMDVKGRIEYVNASFTQVMGYKSKEIIGKEISFLNSNEHSAMFYEEIWNVINNGKNWRGDICQKGKHGRSVWQLQSISPVKNEYGDIIRFVAVTIGDTERKIAENKLRKSSEKLERTIDIAGLGSWTWDLENDTFSYTQKAREILGITDLSHVDKFESFIQFIASESRHEFKSKIYNAFEMNENKFDMEHPIVLPDGSRRFVYEEAEIEYGNRKDSITVISTIRDITEKKMHDEEILKAQKLESLGVLAGGLAHDFNNLLTIIIGNVSFAKSLVAGKDAKIEKLLTDVEKASQRAGDLTKHLISFAKGSKPIKENTNIIDIIKEAFEIVPHGTSIDSIDELHSDFVMVNADAGQVSQVFHNLFLNSVQAMNEGGKLILKSSDVNIEDDSFLKKGIYVKFDIIDNGIGIEKENLSKIFDPYFTTKDSGTGLGLASCYSIIKKHGGTIVVDSMIDEGTTFSVYLPLSGIEEVVGKIKDEKKYTKGTGRVLVMDDEVAVNNFVQLVLEHSGYECDYVRNGEDAIDTYKDALENEKPYDLIIMDLTIVGGMGGKDAILDILKINENAKAIVSSGYSEDPILTDCEKYGFKASLHKPYEMSLLLKTVYEVINK